MYRSQAPMGDFVEMRYWCGSRLWRCRIKRVSSCAEVMLLKADLCAFVFMTKCIMQERKGLL